jgi:hypothetical protein
VTGGRKKVRARRRSVRQAPNAMSGCRFTSRAGRGRVTLALPFAAALVASGLASASETGPAKRIVCDRLIDDFASTPAGEFPRGWRTRDAGEMPAATADKLHVVELDGGKKVLHSTHKREAITIGRKIPDWKLTEYPYLEWRWKAVKLPLGGDERESGTNDSGAGVYVIWDVGFPFYVDGIKYAWSTTLPVGTRLSRRLGHDQLVVSESGARHLGKWRTVRVNVLDHHRRFFDRDEPRAPDGIALLTDADSTGTEAEAYYADFRLCREVK